MYLTSFIHREELFEMTERWLCGRLERRDGLRITQLLICDGFVLGETLQTVTHLLLRMIYDKPFRMKPIRYKGELRDAICRNAKNTTPRVEELVDLYKNKPDFFYRESPIHGVTFLDRQENLLGLYRIKRPRRVAEKANRYIAHWIFGRVRERAQEMAEGRAQNLGIPVEKLLTPQEEMTREFMKAEETIAGEFKASTLKLDRAAMTIHDVGGIKIISDEERLSHLKGQLVDSSKIKIVDKEEYSGDYQADSLILEVPWDKEPICRGYLDTRAWKRYLNRGISENQLRKGLDPLLKDSQATLNIELILSTFPDMVESELGKSIHEERIIAQRDHKAYKGYIPTNVEYLIEYLFAVGLSPQVSIDSLPVKLWGRYLSDTISTHIRKLYHIPEHGGFY
jgi:hypothetical protein